MEMYERSNRRKSVITASIRCSNPWRSQACGHASISFYFEYTVRFRLFFLALQNFKKKRKYFSIYDYDFPSYSIFSVLHDMHVVVQPQGLIFVNILFISS